MATEIIKYEFEADTGDATRELRIFKEKLSDLDGAFQSASSSFTYLGTIDLRPMYHKIGNAFKKTTSLVASFTNGVKDSIAAITDLQNKSALGSVAEVLSGMAIGKAISEATKSAIDYTETVNLFTVAMKESLPTAKKFVRTLSDMYGLDPKTLMDSVGLFYEMGYAVNMPDKAARQLSTDLTALTTDVASLFNYDVESVQKAMVSGLRGQSRAVIKYGMDLRATTVEQYAMSKGITQNYETMNEASREILRYLVILEQTKDAQGDFAKTIETPANQLRIFKEQAAQFGRTLGQFVLAPLNALLPVVNGVVMAFRMLLSALASFLGFDYDFSYLDQASGTTSDLADNIDSVGSAAKDTAKDVKNMLAPFDELNILQKESQSAKGGKGGATAGSGVVDPKILKLLDETDYKLKSVRMSAMNARDAILEFFGAKYDTSTGDLNTIPGGFIDNLKTAFDKGDYSGVGAIIGNKLNDVVALLPDTQDWHEISGSFKSWVENFLTALNSTINTFDWKAFGRSIGLALANAFNLYSFVVENFDFENFGRKLGSGLSGFLNKQTFESAATALANKLRILPRLASGFIEGFEWVEFGENFGNAITTFFDTFSVSEYLGAAIAIVTHLADALALSIITAFNNGTFDKIGRNLAESLQNLSWLTALTNCANTIVTALGALLSSFIKNFDFAQFGTDLATNMNNFFTNFKESELYTSALELLSKLQDGLIHFLDTADWTGVGKALVDVLERINWGRLLASVANAIGEALFGGIKEAISNFSDDITPSRSGGSSGKYKGSGRSGTYNFAMASGGVVRGPTRALISEGMYDEAVVPLGNSPQLAEMLDRFADVAANRGTGETNVKVYIGDKEWDAFTYESAQRGEKVVGSNPIKGE